MTVISIAAFKDNRRRKTRARSLEPYCGPCLDKTGEIEDLVPHLVRLPGGQKITGYSCPECGLEFDR